MSSCPLSKEAGEHHEHRATHGREAARPLEAGDHEAAAHHANSAQSHLHHATHHAAEAAKLHVEHQGQKTKEEVNEKMATYLSIVFGALLKSLTVAGGALYAGMVLMKYRTAGRCYRLNLELRDPARAAEHFSPGLRPSGHQRKRPLDNRFCASQNPWPS
jgi:hypothetical protein